MHGSITQPVLGATGHHLLNRQIDGTLDEHLASWDGDELYRAATDVNAELDRVRKYQSALLETRDALLRAEW